MSDLTLDKIKYHALKLFAKEGYSGTSMRDIAKSVGMKAPSIYKHYSSKEELFISVLDYCLNKHSEVLHNAIDRTDYENIREQKNGEILYKIFSARINFFKRNEDLYKFFIRFSVFPPEEVKDIVKLKWKEYNDKINENTSKLYGLLIENKLIKPISKKEFISTFYRIIIGYIIHFSEFEDDLENDNLNEIWNVFWNGLKNNE